MPGRVTRIISNWARPRLSWLLGALLLANAASLWADDSDPTFFRGVNLNGPPLVIDGQAWQGGDATDLLCDDAAFDNQSVALRPPTDADRARMIRSSRWTSQGRNRIVLSGVPPGTYSVFLYVWEDNDPQTFDVLLQGQVVVAAHHSGRGGQWNRLGPWVIDVADATIELGSQGGHANFSGIEVWHGALTAADRPLPELSASKAAAPQLSPVANVMARNCLECHNASDRHGGLDLTHRAAALTGGDSGPAIVPGDADGSLLWRRVVSGEMPPDGRAALPDTDREMLRDWLAAGATWEPDPIDPFSYTSDRRAGYNWWSLQAVRPTAPPEVAEGDWPINDIDRFIWRGLNQAGLRPSPPAERRALIRRLSFDLLGLPPSPEEVEQFVDDHVPGAYERLVDRYLDSPHYGERWARHWLDVVRFGESQGFERNKFRPNAWRYRDWVVEAFNADLPYDDFIRWQIAGDLLRPDDPLAVIASGFLVVGPYDLTAYTTGTADMQAAAREEEIEGLVGTVCQTFLGLTVNCARCHDHKFDPITQREYYQVAAALYGTYQGEERESLNDQGRSAASERAAELRRRIEDLNARMVSADQATMADLAARRSRWESLIGLLGGGPAHVTVPRDPGACYVLARGDFRQPGEVVPPAGIAAVGGPPADWGLDIDAPEADRRRALAAWITDPANPLTARVIVNRLWGYHFGVGLVPTPSDFGFQGGRPSHPGLLDWLANELAHPADGTPWTLKRIQRLIVTSATYRQASRGVPAAAAVDAENRLLWRVNPRRLEAEQLRDAVLSVAGQLDARIGGPGFRDFTISTAGENDTFTISDQFGGEFNRRGLYRTWLRTGTSAFLDTFDCPC
jgi:hypothetical protein